MSTPKMYDAEPSDPPVIEQHQECVALADQLRKSCSMRSCEFLIVLMPRVDMGDGQPHAIVTTHYGPRCSQEDAKDTEGFARRIMGLFGLELPAELPQVERFHMPDGSDVDETLRALLAGNDGASKKQ